MRVDDLTDNGMRMVKITIPSSMPPATKRYYDYAQVLKHKLTKADFVDVLRKCKLSSNDVESLKSVMEAYPKVAINQQQTKWLDEWSKEHPSGQPQPSEQWQALKADFEALCEKQERLYKPDFEKVFNALFEIDSEQRAIYNTNFWDFGEALPDEADKDKLQMALQQTGFANDEAFCKAFIGYANTTIQGKKVQRQMATLNVAEVMNQQQPPQKQDGWQFCQISFVAPQGMHDVINAQIEADAKEGKGLFANVTTTPVEDESEDEYLMIDVYNCKASLVPFVEEIKQFGVVGNSNALFGNDTKRLLLATVKECATFVKGNTDKPAAAKNHITATLQEFDKMPVWGLLFQILILQGLCRWLESVNINEGDNGFNEVQCFYNWLLEALAEKMMHFCYTPFGENDKERLQPLCAYLYSTEVGKVVQRHLFGEPQQEAFGEPQQEAAPATQEAAPAKKVDPNKRQAKKRGRQSKPFSSLIVGNSTEIKDRLHNLIDGKADSKAVIFIKAAIMLGVIQKPTYTQFKEEFGEIASKTIYNKYISQSLYSDDEINGAKQVLQPLQ